MLFVLYLIWFDNIFAYDVCIHAKQRRNMSFCKIFSKQIAEQSLQTMWKQYRCDRKLKYHTIDNPETHSVPRKNLQKVLNIIPKKEQQKSVCARAMFCGFFIVFPYNLLACRAIRYETMWNVMRCFCHWHWHQSMLLCILWCLPFVSLFSFRDIFPHQVQSTSSSTFECVCVRFFLICTNKKNWQLDNPV